MRNILLIIANTMKVTFRKKGNIVIYIFLPLVGVFLSILIYSGSGSSVLRIGLLDRDAGLPADDLKGALEATEGFKIQEVEENEISGLLLDQKLDAAVVIPSGYSDGIYSGKPAEITVISVKGRDTTVWIEQILNNYTDTLHKLGLASNGDRGAFDKMYVQYRADAASFETETLNDEKTGKSMAVTSVGFLIMFMMLGSGLITSFILKEKRDRTYYRICSAPVNAGQYIAANSVTGLIIVMIQTVLIQLALGLVFHIDTGVGAIPMFIILILFGVVAVGLGLAIASISSSSYMAGTLNSVIMTPTCMLGGCYWPVSLMPDFMQKISYFVPQRWAIDAIQKLQAGGGQGDIAINLVILAAFAAAFILIAIYRFSRSGNLRKFV